MAAKYLGQVVAIETDVRKASARKLTEAYHALDKTALLEGLTGEYTPAFDEGEQLPPEGTRVQATVEDMIASTRETLANLYDITAARDFTNSSGTAKADIAVGDQVLVNDAPVPYILWLDRQLDDLQAFVTRIPTHSPSTLWELAEARGVYASTPVKTARQVQQHKVITVAPATDKHPAQAQVVAEQVTAGTWTRIKFSGAVPVSRREVLLRRIATLRAAVHAAREQANRVEAVEPAVGERILGYLFD